MRFVTGKTAVRTTVAIRRVGVNAGRAELFNNQSVESHYFLDSEIDSSEIIYNQDEIDQTFWFDEELLGANMTDFFQKRPVEYAKGQGITADDLF